MSVYRQKYWLNAIPSCSQGPSQFLRFVSIPFRSFREEAVSNGVCLKSHFSCTQGCSTHMYTHTLTHTVVSPDGDYRDPHRFSVFDWVRCAGDRKKNNQFHESRHARFYLCHLPISFHFLLSLKTKLTDAPSFDQSILNLHFQNTKV